MRSPARGHANQAAALPSLHRIPALKITRRLPHRGLEHGGKRAVAGIAAGGADLAHRHAARQHRQCRRQHGLLAPLLVAGAEFGAEQARYRAFAGADVAGPFGQGGGFARCVPLRHSPGWRTTRGQGI